MKTLTENEISYIIRGCIFNIHNQIGPGLLESSYVTILKHELEKHDLFVSTEVPVPCYYEGIKMEVGYRADMMVNDKVIVEVKSTENLAEVHHKQLLTYLKMSGRKLGILVNFNTVEISKSIFRKVNGL